MRYGSKSDAEKKIYGCKSRIPTLLESRGFTLLDRSDGGKDKVLLLWIFPHKDGSEIRCWEDSLLGNVPLQEQYPTLYSITCKKSNSLAQVVE